MVLAPGREQGELVLLEREYGGLVSMAGSVLIIWLMRRGAGKVGCQSRTWNWQDKLGAGQIFNIQS